MEQMIKNIPHETVLSLAGEVAQLPGQVVSKTLSQNGHHSLTLFAFAKDEEISTHASDGDAMVLVLEGTARITIDGNARMVTSGETIIMPAGHPHAVYAQDDMKMLLIVMFDN